MSPRARRFDRPGDARFLTFSCYHRLPLLSDPRTRNRFVEHLGACRDRLGFKLMAYVVMPEHTHLLVFPGPKGHPVPTILRAIKGEFANEMLSRWRSRHASILSRLLDAAGKERFWLPGGGYDRNVFSQRELHEKIDYIHANPLRRGLVTNALDWPWSSAIALCGGSERALIPVDRVR